MDDTRRTLFEHFDEDVHQRLRLQLDDAKAQLDRFGQRFWSLTRFMLDGRARFDDDALAFDLERPPREEIATGRYHLISKSHPSGPTKTVARSAASFSTASRTRWASTSSTAQRQLTTPSARIVFDVSRHPTRIHAVEALRGKSGFLTLTRLDVDSYEREEYLLFSGFDESGASLDQETMEKLFSCSGRVEGNDALPAAVLQRLPAEAERHAKATLSRSLEQNSVHFNQARVRSWRSGPTIWCCRPKRRSPIPKSRSRCYRRLARQVVTLNEEHEIQQKIQKLEKQQRRQRQEIFQAEDSIIEKRDALIESLERRLTQQTGTERLFTIEWAVI